MEPHGHAQGEQEMQSLDQDQGKGAFSRYERAELVFREQGSVHPQESTNPIPMESSYRRGLAPQRRNHADWEPPAPQALHANRKLGSGPFSVP